MKKATAWAMGAGALALAGALAWAFAPRPVAVEVASARLGDFESAVEEDARTRVRQRHTVAAPLAGRLRRITLEPGDAVSAGAVVATLEPVLAPMLDERSLREQQARAAAAQVAVERAGTRVGAARVALEQARLDAQRTRQLVAQGFVSPAKADNDRLALQAAQRELEVAQESERIARHERDQAQAALGVTSGARGGAAATPFAVRAPVAGRVLKVHQPSEAVVSSGTALLDLGDTARLEVVAELLTSDAALAHPGSPVRIERWGGPAVLAGRVRRVEPGAFTKVSALGVEEQRVNVLIDLDETPPEPSTLGDGWRVVARIVTRRESGVLTVPVSAVFPWPQGVALPSGPVGAPAAMGVFVIASGRARLKPVQVGARNGSVAWIRDGLGQGEAVIVYPPPAVADGVAVQVRSQPSR